MSLAIPSCHWLSLARRARGYRQQGVGESKGLFQRVVRGSGVGPLGMSPLAGGQEGGRGGSTKGERGP